MNDLINSLFEFFAAFAIANHCRILIKDKSVRGISILSVFFFTLWGAWNLHYYKDLEQSFSFYAGILVFVVNIWYVYLLMKYRRNDV